MIPCHESLAHSCRCGMRVGYLLIDGQTKVVDVPGPGLEGIALHNCPLGNGVHEATPVPLPLACLEQIMETLECHPDGLTCEQISAAVFDRQITPNEVWGALMELLGNGDVWSFSGFGQPLASGDVIGCDIDDESPRESRWFRAKLMKGCMP